MACALTLAQSVPVSWRRFVGSKSLPPCLGTDATPGIAFPRLCQTPVVSRPLALARTGLLPSGHCIPSALGPVARTYPLSTIIHFSEFNDAACVLALPLLRTPPLSDRTSVRLPTWWLAFGRVGLEDLPSHPLGNIDMFQEVSPLSSRPGFISARAPSLFGMPCFKLLQRLTLPFEVDMADA